MTAAVKFQQKPLGWVLDRAASCFVPIIRARAVAGEEVRADVFMVERQRFARIRFGDPSRPDLILAMEARP